MQANASPDDKGHEVCNQTIENLVKLVETQKALLATTLASLEDATKTISTLNCLLALAPSGVAEKRRKGRPKKSVNDLRLLEMFNETMLPEFVAANQTENPTDRRVLTWYFTKEYARYGWSASRVRGKVFQGKLKTLQNRLSDVRNPVPRLPIK